MSEQKLLDEIAELKERLAALEERTKPPKPFVSDHVPRSPNWLLDRASMPPSAMRVMVEAVPDAMVRQIVKGNGAPADLTPLLTPLAKGGGAPSLAAENRSGWRNPAPMGPPPGIELCDRLVDLQDQRDRAELILQEAKRLATTKAKEPNAA